MTVILKPNAYHGLAGEIARTIEPHTEADISSLLFTLFAAFGNTIGRTAYFKSAGQKHYANLNVIQVGRTLRDVNASFDNNILGMFRDLDPEWSDNCTECSLSTKDTMAGFIKASALNKETDKRLMIIDPEFAVSMKKMNTTLSSSLRSAYDTGNISLLWRNSITKAMNTHVSILTGITRELLSKHFNGADALHSYGSRFIWICTHRANILPDGGDISDAVLHQFKRRLDEAAAFAMGVGEMKRDEEAAELWREAYPELTKAMPGVKGALSTHSEIHVMKLACIYALLDMSSVIRKEHLQAALGIWVNVDASITLLFGKSIGDPVADEILKTIERSEEVVTKTDLINHFNRNKSAKDIDHALEKLRELGLIRMEIKETPGRPQEIWRHENTARRSSLISSSQRLQDIRDAVLNSLATHPQLNNT